MASVSVRDLTKLYPASKSGVRGISLDIVSGEHFVIVGPSGAGKTTVLRLIAGLEKTDSGVIIIAGQDVTRWAPHRRRVALVAQRPALYPHMTVRRNLAASVEFRQGRFFGTHKPEYVSPAELAARVVEVAGILGLTPLLDRQPRHLSGGEQQRVALGRAWVARAAVWLLDEPLAHLDPGLRAEIRGQLHLLRSRSGATMIEVTHDPVEAPALGQRLAVLRDGLVEQVGPPAELYDRPRTRAVAMALGGPPMNLADAVVAGDDGRLALRTPVGWELPLPASRAVEPGRAVTVGVRPEHIMARGDGDGLVPLGNWSVTRAEPRGPAWLLTVARPGLSWQVWWPENPAAAVLPLAVPADVFYLFDGNTGERVEQ
ncbi:MAG TPA: ABC transporter ATP-binding protein [Gemmataceae bacterium]|nr:ABC transporter ATP-binding protein [Gemmataceae bacterium]